MLLGDFVRQLVGEEVSIISKNKEELYYKEDNIIKSKGPITCSEDGISVLSEITVEEAMKIYETGECGSIAQIEELLKINNILLEHEKITPEMFIKFVAFHELGHWKQRDDVAIKNSKEQKVKMKEYKDIWKEIQKQAGNLQPIYELMKNGFELIKQQEVQKEVKKMENNIKKLLQQQSSLYRTIPTEKAADQYAVERFNEYIEAY